MPTTVPPLRALPRRLADRLTMQPMVQQALLPFGRELTPKRWIFVLGCYNSGTTLLATMLRQHPEIGGLPTEGVYLTDSLPYPERFGWPRMWCRCVDDVRLNPKGEEARAARIRRQWSLWYPRDAENLVEKSVANAARIPFLGAHFRPAYFIYIVRNGYAAAAGIRDKANLRRWRNPYRHMGYPIELCAEQWLQTDETVAADRPAADHFLSVYYEDLASRPRETLGAITEFLGMQAVADATIARQWEVHGDCAPVQDMNANSLARLSADDIERVEAVAGERLRQHGYARPLVERDERPAARPNRETPVGQAAEPGGTGF